MTTQYFAPSSCVPGLLRGVPYTACCHARAAVSSIIRTASWLDRSVCVFLYKTTPRPVARIAEAFYRSLPILVLAAVRPVGVIGVTVYAISCQLWWPSTSFRKGLYNAAAFASVVHLVRSIFNAVFFFGGLSSLAAGALDLGLAMIFFRASGLLREALND